MSEEHIVCQLEDLPPGTRRIVKLGRLEFGVYNVNGSIVALRNLCPHAGAPLCFSDATGTVVSSAPGDREWGFDGAIVKCPWHGWEFELPSGETLVEPKQKVLTFVGHVDPDGNVVVKV